MLRQAFLRMLPRRLKQRVKDSLTKLLPRGDSFELSLSRLAPDLEIVFDVGANVGDMTMSMCERFLGATVYAFEPCSTTFETLRARVEASPYRDRIRLHRLGFSDTNGTGLLHVTSHHGANSLVDITSTYRVFNPHVREEDTENVKLVRLDDFVGEAGIRHIDLMKVDVEGAEYEVFAGGVRTMSSMVDTVFCEISFARHSRERGEYIRVCKLLHDCGFAPAEIYDVAQGDTSDSWRLAQFDCVFKAFRPSVRAASQVGVAVKGPDPGPA